MKLLMLCKYYPETLKYFYEKYPFIISSSFEEHRSKILDEHFGWTGDLSRYINLQGIQTEFIIANAESMQKKWADEHKFQSYSERKWEKEIVMEQIKHFRPDVLWVGSLFDYYGNFLKNALHYCKKAITWVSCPTPANLNISGFTTLITSNPSVLRKKQHLFNNVIVTKPGFDSEILKKLGYVGKKYYVTFIGGITPAHLKRVEILAYLIKKGIDIKVFGYINEERRRDALLHAAGCVMKHRDVCKGKDALKRMFTQRYQRDVEITKSVHQGPIFGLDMYHTLAKSRITLNIHIDVAGSYAGNMRIFEGTGVGSCVLTEHTENINSLFKLGKEILTYRSKEELLDVLQSMMKQDEKIDQISKAGQKRTLNIYTIEKMFNDIKQTLNI